jgi:type I restriction enzyme S subunit
MKQNWEIKKLSEVLKIQNGYAFDAKLFTIEKGTPLIRIRDIKEGIGTVTNFNGKYDKKYEVNAGDFLIGMDGEFGCYEWKGDTALLNQRVCRLQEFSNKLYPRFLFYGINKYLKAIEDVTAFATVKHISSKQIENIEIPLPPLAEQQRIVAILDEAFAAIAKAKANAEQNLKNAKVLFESYLQGVFDPSTRSGQGNKGEGWDEKMLGEMIEIKNGKNQQAVLSETGKYKIMGSAGNVMGYATDFICEAGTTIIGRKGNISNPLYINERFWNVDTAFGFYPKNEKDIDKRFIYYLCLGIDFKSMNRGTTIPSLVKSELQTIQICFPKSLKIQQTIVQKLDAISAETKKLEAIYQQKINDLEELKKSILQKAFSGELRGGEPVEPKTEKV